MSEAGPRMATFADASPLARALGAAFNDDPVYRWLMPGGARFPARLERFFGLELREFALRHGHVWTSDDLAGAALAMPPGAWRLPLSVQVTHAFGFARTFGHRLGRAVALQARMERRHLRAPHYYIAFIGVAPEAQGRGLGARLMRPTLDRCDAERLPAYLEATSERSAALYERLGFRIEGELRVRTSPPLWPMRRPPAGH